MVGAGEGRVTALDNASRVVIERVRPEIDCGRFPIKRTVGDRVIVEADIFADGTELLGAVLQYRREETSRWTEAPMTLVDNDRWRGEFTAADLGRYRYTLQAWVDRFASWARDLRRIVAARQDTAVELEIGSALVRAAGRRGNNADASKLATYADILRRGGDEGVRLALSDELAALMASHPDRERAATYERQLGVQVDRLRARVGAWYEMFPRSCAPEAGHHGTFADAEARLPYVAAMGFDVLYLPPIHPIGRSPPQGTQQRRDRRSGGSRQPVGDRRVRGGPQERPRRARDAR